MDDDGAWSSVDEHYTDPAPQSVAEQPDEQHDTMSYSERVKSHQFASVLHSREALCSLLELSYTGFLFSQDTPVVDKGFTEIPRS